MPSLSHADNTENCGSPLLILPKLVPTNIYLELPCPQNIIAFRKCVSLQRIHCPLVCSGIYCLYELLSGTVDKALTMTTKEEAPYQTCGVAWKLMNRYKSYMVNLNCWFNGHWLVLGLRWPIIKQLYSLIEGLNGKQLLLFNSVRYSKSSFNDSLHECAYSIMSGDKRSTIWK